MTSDNIRSRSLIREGPSCLSAALGPDLTQAINYARASNAQATRKAYASDWLIFTTWCAARFIAALPADPEVVAAFLAAEAQRKIKPTTISRRVAAIRYAHRSAGLDAPTGSEAVRATLRGIRRVNKNHKTRKSPATADKLIAMVTAAPTTKQGLRDRALLSLGFAGAFRRSELVALDVADIAFCKRGMLITIRRSKTDQEGDGATIAIVKGKAACPVQAVKEWLTATGIRNGPLFRSMRRGDRVTRARLSYRAVAETVKRHAKRIGLDAADFSGHSLRSGFLTSAAARGSSLFKMMDISRHKSVETLRGYVRDADIFRGHAGKGLL
jgi:site-specific recombinase XerD